jgi:hypothetical protein
MKAKLEFFPCALCGYPVPIEKAIDPQHVFCKASCSRKFGRGWMPEDAEECLRAYYHKVAGSNRGNQFDGGFKSIISFGQRIRSGADIQFHKPMPQMWEQFFREIDSARAESKRINPTADNIVQCEG